MLWLPETNVGSIMVINPSTQQVVIQLVGFDHPYGITVDSMGYIWLGDNAIKKLSPVTGAVLGTWNFGLSNINGMAMTMNDKLLICESGGGAVRLMDVTAGVIAKSFALVNPVGIAVDRQNVDLFWVSSVALNNVMCVSISQGVVTKTYNGFSYPQSLAMDLANNLWVSLATSGTVAHVNATSGLVLETYTAGSSGVAVDPPTGNIWAVDSLSLTLTKILWGSVKVASATANQETTDGDALCDLYNAATNQVKLTNWCGSKSYSTYVNGPCTGASAWRGVTCTSGRVTSLNLNFVGLGGGSIPESLGGLTGLTYLQIQGNGIGGSIPTRLGQLTNLNALNLAGNSLSGSVPFSFCQLPSAINLQVHSNPALTCYPSCLASYRNFISGSLSAVCPSQSSGEDALQHQQQQQILATASATFSAAVLAGGLANLVAAAFSSDRAPAPAPPDKNFP